MSLKQNIILRIRKIQFAILKVAAITPPTLKIYSDFFTRAFNRESRAVLKGKIRYHASLNNDALYLLRRNTHRLEKGLIMRPRRALFAENYIQETVEAYLQVCKADPSDKTAAKLEWTTSVLAEYFDCVEGFDLADQLRKQFNEAQETLKKPSQQKTPYPSEKRPACPVTYDDFLTLSKRRRSVRWYKDQPVSQEVIDAALTAANQSPSACNRQPFKFHIFNEPSLAQEIGAIPMGTAGFAQNFPALAVIVGDLSAYFHERDRHAIYIDGSLAAMSFMLALETLGLSSCPINWPDTDPQESIMKERLRLEDYERPILLISFGYALEQGGIPFSDKKDLSRFRSYNDDV